MKKHAAIIISDAAGYPNRAAIVRRTAEAAGVPFLLISPADHPQPDSLVQQLPDAWLPAAGDDDRRDWYRNHLAYVLAIRTSGIEADFYWCAEADVSASPATWLRLLETTADMPHDGLWTRLYHRDESPENGWFKNPTTPAWADWYCLGAIFRISRRAVDWLEQSAEESREVFTEICVPSEIARRGGTIARINREHHAPLYDCGTMKFTVRRGGVISRPMRNPQRFMHPVKRDEEPPPAPVIDPG